MNIISKRNFTICKGYLTKRTIVLWTQFFLLKYHNHDDHLHLLSRLIFHPYGIVTVSLVFDLQTPNHKNEIRTQFAVNMVKNV